MISITRMAKSQLKNILGSHKAIFFGAKGGGCNGFKYDLKPTNKIEKGDIYFKYLIKEAKHYIEFENTINYLIG